MTASTMPAAGHRAPAKAVLKKLPEITLAFWVMKIAATTLGETAGGAYIVGRDRACLSAQGWHDVEYYHPASSFWRFQWTQAGVEAVAIALLTTFILVRIRRRAW